MKLSQVRVISTALLISILSSCSGAGSGVASLGDGSGGGIGGSGVTSSGTINGFGSIFVNGVEFETDTADIVINGDTSTDSALRLGMIVLVTGTLNEDGVTGTADRVEFSNEVQGPIESIVGGSDGNTALIMVLGTQIIVERTTTVFDSAVFNSLAIGDLVEISGFPTSAGRLVATRVERISAFISGESEVELSGIVTRLSGTLFELNNVVVDFGSADVSQLRGGTISQGLAVAVRGTLEDGILLAERITDRAEIARDLDDDDSVTVQGSVSNFSSLAMFKIGGLMVDGSSASLEPDSIALDNGSIVEVEGLWRGDVLIASEIKARRGTIKVEASVTAINAENSTIILQLFGGTLSVKISARTLLDDNTHLSGSFTLHSIAIGDFLEVEAISVNGSLIATSIERDELDDDVLQGRVESFTAGVDITIQGITYFTRGSAFEDLDDNSISSEAFYSRLEVGDLVKIKDEDVADGIADEVEFE
ncbi:MAG: hypothetical protein ACJAUG_000587 [Halioglobus sp.]|jgi:hypothetical protein